MYQLVRGIRIEVLTDSWVAYSPLSGESLLLNTEAAAVLEVLAEGPAEVARICQLLAMDTELSATELDRQLRDVWPQLENAGLICTASSCGDNLA